MMNKENHNAHLNIDWDALDKNWADQYEEDYGCHFSDMYFNGIKTHFHSLPQYEEGIVSSI